MSEAPPRWVERGPWCRLNYDATEAVRCWTFECDNPARWMRTRRMAGSPVPIFEHSCRDHAEGLAEQEARAEERRRRLEELNPDQGGGRC